MHYRNFKGTKVAEVGLGTWQLGSADWGAIDSSTAFAILQAYVDAGGNFLDTSDVYGMGVSERIIGEFLKSTDKKIYVATKLGRRHDAPNGWPQNFTDDAICCRNRLKMICNDATSLCSRQMFASSAVSTLTPKCLIRPSLCIFLK